MKTYKIKKQTKEILGEEIIFNIFGEPSDVSGTFSYSPFKKVWLLEIETIGYELLLNTIEKEFDSIDDLKKYMSDNYNIILKN